MWKSGIEGNPEIMVVNKREKNWFSVDEDYEQYYFDE